MQKMNAIFLIMKNLDKKNFFIFFILFILFFLKGFYFLDPDFGWHLKTGEFMLQRGIPKTDPFSYTMPSYPFVDHEWLSNIIIYSLFFFIGSFGLSILFSLLAIIVIVISTRSIPVSISLSVVIIIGVIFISFTGIRVQVISWMCCSLLVSLLLNNNNNKGLMRLIPLGILIWSNLHGSFPLGILILFIFYICKYVKTKKINSVDASILILSVAVTFLPPYGWRRWWEVWMQMSDGSLRWSIQEWTPLFFMNINIALIGYLALSLALFIKYFHKINLFLKTLYFIFLFMAVTSIRHIPLWLFVSCFQLAFCFKLLFQEVSDKQIQNKITKFVFHYALVLCAIQFILICVAFPIDIKYSRYPYKAIEYLKRQNIKGNVFNTYGWGGLLIWKYPEKRVFIDGRMPSWRWKAPLNESSNAFEEWRKIMSGKEKIKIIQKKYNLDVVFVPTSQQMYMCEKPSKLGLLFKTYNKTREKNVFKDLKTLYQDNIATIYSLN